MSSCATRETRSCHAVVCYQQAVSGLNRNRRCCPKLSHTSSCWACPMCVSETHGYIATLQLCVLLVLPAQSLSLQCLIRVHSFFTHDHAGHLCSNDLQSWVQANSATAMHWSNRDHGQLKTSATGTDCRQPSHAPCTNMTANVVWTGAVNQNGLTAVATTVMRWRHAHGCVMMVCYFRAPPAGFDTCLTEHQLSAGLVSYFGHGVHVTDDSPHHKSALGR